MSSVTVFAAGAPFLRELSREDARGGQISHTPTATGDLHRQDRKSIHHQSGPFGRQALPCVLYGWKILLAWLPETKDTPKMSGPTPFPSTREHRHHRQICTPSFGRSGSRDTWEQQEYVEALLHRRAGRGKFRKTWWRVELRASKFLYPENPETRRRKLLLDYREGFRSLV